MVWLCSDCKCPVDADAKGIRHCRNVGAESRLSKKAKLARKVQCCRCACLDGNFCCLFCIELLRERAVNEEKAMAITFKRRASDALDKADLDLDAERKELEEAMNKVGSIQKKIRELEEAHDRIKDMEEVQRAVQVSMEVAKLELSVMEKDAGSRKRRIEKLEGKNCLLYTSPSPRDRG
eukprot:3349097-Rhodomonas_salina.1